MSPRTEKENSKIRSQRKTDIINVSLQLFALQGYHKTSISEIAQKAGISKGLLYNYFDSKQDLLKQVIQYNYKKSSDTLFDLIYKKAKILLPDELKKYGIEMFFKMMIEQADIWRLSISLSMQVSAMSEIREITQKIFLDTYKQLAMLLDDNTDGDMEAEAKLLAATLDGIALHYYAIGKAFDLESVKSLLIRNMFGDE